MGYEIPDNPGMEEKRKMDFSPQGKSLEYKFANIMRKEINKMDVSDEEKDSMKEIILKYLYQYETEYKRYYKAFKYYHLPSPGLI